MTPQQQNLLHENMQMSELHKETSTGDMLTKDTHIDVGDLFKFTEEGIRVNLT